MQKLMQEERFNFIADEDKAFILAFDKEVQKLGYHFGNEIGGGFCWGRYMIIYSKTGVKQKKVAARIYIREDGIVLRLFFSKIDGHREYIENAPGYIKEVFTGSHGDCQHCENKPDGLCGFRKTYTIDGRLIEKCSGVVFEFWKPAVDKLPGYIDLFKEFYPVRNAKQAPRVKSKGGKAV